MTKLNRLKLSGMLMIIFLFFIFLSLLIWFGIRNSLVFEGLKWEVGHGFLAAITTGPFSSTAR